MATFIVQTLTDKDDGTTDPNDANLSLREAIRIAGTNISKDTITFRDDLAGGTISLTQGELDIRLLNRNDVLTIDGDINDDHLPDISIDAQGQSRVINIDPTPVGVMTEGAPVTLDGLEITGGKALFDGGIRVESTPFTLVNSIVRNNEATFGGGVGINNTFGGPVETHNVIMDSTISENTAAGSEPSATSRGSSGGGLFFRRAFVTVVNSTISANTATGSGGGGILGFNARQLTLVNSTVSGNRATGDTGLGAGIESDASITLNNVTVSGNDASGTSGAGGGISQDFGGSLSLNNSIVAGNAAGASIDDIAGTIAMSNGANIFSETNVLGAVPGDQQGVDPALVFDQTSQIRDTGAFAGVLADNGGPTQTIALNPTGLAVDAGGEVSLEAPGPNRQFEAADLPTTDDVPLVFDQRGPNFDRIVGRAIDVGAFEVQEQAPFFARVNFEPSGAPVPDGFQADTGQVFADRGNGFSYGWNHDNSAATRDRNSNLAPNQAYDTLIHTQRFGDRTWEIAVPDDGQYMVHLVAGDPSFQDSFYRFTVEGTPAISASPTKSRRYIEQTRLVSVHDGKLTIANRSGAVNNKLAFVEVAEVSGTPTRINFQPSGANVPSGFLADRGQVFGDRGNGLSYGWDQRNTAATRDRNNSISPNQAYDTLTHTQRFGNRTWEIAVANGFHTVHLVAGDPSFTDSQYEFNVEGSLTVMGHPTSTAHWVEGLATVLVADGRLTISNSDGAVNNKLAFVEIDGSTIAGGSNANSPSGPPVQFQALSDAVLPSTNQVSPAGQFVTASGNQPAGHMIELSNDELDHSLFVSGSVSGMRDTLSMAAWDERHSSASAQSLVGIS